MVLTRDLRAAHDAPVPQQAKLSGRRASQALRPASRRLRDAPAGTAAKPWGADRHRPLLTVLNQACARPAALPDSAARGRRRRPRRHAPAGPARFHGSPDQQRRADRLRPRDRHVSFDRVLQLSPEPLPYRWDVRGDNVTITVSYGPLDAAFTGSWREDGTFSGGWHPNPGADESVNVPYDIGGRRPE
jgi:hypothetical protein